MLTKEKLLDLKTPEFQNVFSSFQETYPMDIILIDKIKRFAFYPITSQNGLGRHISKIRNARNLNQGSNLFSFKTKFKAEYQFWVNPPFKM